ncbi:tannase and feruloyl esterase [Aaosphaeria arxii CBS 175.79]|uniref:Carboxylic ester hydrolase n=1 Tax=Aaosphaeria arxii CBS 175.79 TaxID=1450172 RepID=A0A6A5XSC0_9PLEO|nr:tannase and feruloyl esterase [Aaosphaeria arxii CBS 175.79]KAF2015164.1 tannase and feruloyl esterase [Aaosphaeria arxii CBS 175.79]
MQFQWSQLVFLIAGSRSIAALQQQHIGTDDLKAKCSAFSGELQIPDATVYLSEVVAAGTNLSLPDYNVTCGNPYQIVPKEICRLSLYVATSNRSGINMEAWLPFEWTGRFLSVGNGGLAGCIGYNDIAYGSSLGFASVGANNGHNGTSGGAFYNNADVLEDFAYRSVHTGVVVGKQITEAFYGSSHKKSYYLGCSTGGRQGFKSAQDFPDDFDGIVAGAPAIAFNNLTSWSGHFYPITGPVNSSTFVPQNLWPVIHADVLERCDALDNFVDGILEDASLCNYTASNLLCGSNSNASACLTEEQVNTVNQIYAPLLASDGSLIYPRMQPGSEILASRILYGGAVFPYTTDWFRYAVYNDINWDPTKINNTDYETAARTNPFNIQTWEGDLSAVQKRGAKILHWHGQMDAIISSDNSPRYYEHVSETMGLSSADLDDFYRYFRVGGTGHCSGGDGAWAIGQNLNAFDSLAPGENILMAIVDWVENGNAPDTLIGTKWNNGTQSAGVDYKRAHCKYPLRNRFKGEGDAKDIEAWECVE